MQAQVKSLLILCDQLIDHLELFCMQSCFSQNILKIKVFNFITKFMPLMIILHSLELLDFYIRKLKIFNLKLKPYLVLDR